MSLRVTQRSIALGTMANLHGSYGRLQKLQEKLSSGREIAKPSDSPTGTVAALRFRADLRRSAQLVRNADDGLAWLATADGALTDGLGTLNRARGLLLSSINGAIGPESREAIAAEIDGLAAHLLATANTTYLGRPLFAGNAHVAAAYDATGTYQGDGGAVNRSVMPDVTVQVNVTGPQAFGGADTVFAVLADLADHLRNDPSQVPGVLARLDERILDMTTSVAQVGARTNQVESMRSRVESRIIDTQGSLGEVESIDLPRTIMDLQVQEVSLQAALAAASRVLQPSLVDFLR